MRRLLATIFLLAFLAGTVFMSLGCGTKEGAGGEGTGIPTAEEQEQQMDEALEGE
jgi:hypothetical protein